jgi:hypothetical protein
MSRAASSAVRAILTSLVLTAAMGAGAAFAATDVGSVNFILGRKSLSNDWTLGPPTQDTTARVGQPALGVELSWGRQDWPVMVALDILHSYDDGIVRIPRFFTIPAYDLRLRARTLELGLGARRTFSVLGWSPYLGAGGSWVRGSAVVQVIDPNAGQFGAVTASGNFHTTAFGYWAGGGLIRRMGSRFQIGLEARYSKATLPIKALAVGQDTLRSARQFDAGGRHINLVVGWSFPVRK